MHRPETDSSHEPAAGADTAGPSGNDEGPSPRLDPESEALPSAEDLQRMFLALNRAVAFGVFSPQQANAIHRNLKAVLDAQLKGQKQKPQGGLPLETLEMCRQHPQFIEALAPFVTDRDLAELLGQLGEDWDDPA